MVCVDSRAAPRFQELFRALVVRLNEKMPYIFPILAGPNNTQYIPILAGLAEGQSSNLSPILAGRLLQDREHTLLKVHTAN